MSRTHTGKLSKTGATRNICEKKGQLKAKPEAEPRSSQIPQLLFRCHRCRVRVRVLFSMCYHICPKKAKGNGRGRGGTISAQIQNHRALSTTDKVPAPLVYRTALRRAIGIAHGGASSHIPCEPYLHLTRHAHARTATGVGTCFAPPPWGEGGGGDARRGLHAATKVGIR